MILTRLIPLEIKFYLSNWHKLHSYKTPSFAEDIHKHRRRIFFLDAPDYNNLGDQAIALAMRRFMAQVLPKYTQYEISVNEYPGYFQWLKKNLSSDDIICLTGGGNMGLAYHWFEAARRHILKHFSKNRIIVFPQTYDYPNTCMGRLERKRAVKIYNIPSRMLLSAREQRSYELMKKDLPSCKVFLCPDIVLSLDYSHLQNRKQGVGICLRDDKESILNNKAQLSILQKFPTAQKLSTIAPSGSIITDKNRQQWVEHILTQFASKSLVVTDRLHGMIFSFITHTPCIAFPNSNGKIKGVYAWIKDYGNTIFVEGSSSFDFEHSMKQTYVFAMQNFQPWKEAIESLCR